MKYGIELITIVAPTVTRSSGVPRTWAASDPVRMPMMR